MRLSRGEQKAFPWILVWTHKKDLPVACFICRERYVEIRYVSLINEYVSSSCSQQRERILSSKLITFPFRGLRFHYSLLFCSLTPWRRAKSWSFLVLSKQSVAIEKRTYYLGYKVERSTPRFLLYHLLACYSSGIRSKDPKPMRGWFCVGWIAHRSWERLPGHLALVPINEEGNDLS